MILLYYVERNAGVFRDILRAVVRELFSPYPSTYVLVLFWDDPLIPGI